MKLVNLLIICTCLIVVDSAPFENYVLDCASLVECAIYNDQEKVVHDLINKNSEILHTKANGRLPIHFAVKHNKMNMLKLFLDKRPDMIDVKNDDGETPLFYAAAQNACNGKEIMVKYLIGKGADVNAKDNIGSTPLHTAAKYGCENIATILLDNKADVNAKDKDEDTPLHMSAQNGTEMVAKLLIESGAKINERRVNGGTPLYMATYFGQLSVARLLINNGCNLDIPDKRDSRPIFLPSLQHNYDDIASLLNPNEALAFDPHDPHASRKTTLYVNDDGTLECEITDMREYTGESPIHLAVIKGFMDIAKLLIENDANLGFDAFQFLPIHWAAWTGNIDLIKLFIDRNISINALAEHYCTPLHVAVDRGNIDTVTFLVENGAFIDGHTCGFTRGKDRLAIRGILKCKSFVEEDLIIFIVVIISAPIIFFCLRYQQDKIYAFIKKHIIDA